jgi:hypothetical protein
VTDKSLLVIGSSLTLEQEYLFEDIDDESVIEQDTLFADIAAGEIGGELRVYLTTKNSDKAYKIVFSGTEISSLEELDHDEHALPSNATKIYDIKFDEGKNLYIATSGGISVTRDDGLLTQHHSSKDNNDDNIWGSVYSLFTSEGSDGVIYFSSENQYGKITLDTTSLAIASGGFESTIHSRGVVLDMYVHSDTFYRATDDGTYIDSEVCRVPYDDIERTNDESYCD